MIRMLAADESGARCLTHCGENKLKVWVKTPTGEWRVSAAWVVEPTSKLTATLKAAWAPVSAGAIVATSAPDKGVHLWQEPPSSRGPRTAEEPLAWTLVATVAPTHEVVDVAFAPDRFGLRVAAACRDGGVRVYEAKDSLVPDRWDAPEEFDALCPAPVLRRPSGRDAADSALPRDGRFAATCICWDPSATTQTLVVGCEDGTVRVWMRRSDSKKWDAAAECAAHRSYVRCVAWAPGMGRSFSLIASGAADACIFVTRLRLLPSGGMSADAPTVLNCPAEVASLQWNSTGTVLASSTDDGLLRLWRPTPPDSGGGGGVGGWGLSATLDPEANAPVRLD